MFRPNAVVCVVRETSVRGSHQQISPIDHLAQISQCTVLSVFAVFLNICVRKRELEPEPEPVLERIRECA